MRKASLALLIAIVALATGCKKNNDTKGTLQLNVAHKHGDMPLVFNNTYTNTNGQDYQLNLANIYITTPTATGEQPHTWSNTYLSFSPDETVFVLDSIPVGSYSGLSFGIGIDSTTNHSDPTTFPEQSPLNPAHPRYQHWAWNTGYIFVKLEGYCDKDNTGVLDDYFFYHLGLDQLYRNYTGTEAFEIAANTTTPLTVTIDYKTIFDQLDFSTSLSTHTMDNINLATSVMDATATAFE